MSPPRPGAQIAHLPPVGSLFAAFLGYNPMQKLLGAPAAGQTHSVLSTLTHAQAAHLTGTSFFPHLISGPFMHGLVIAFSASLVMCLIAAAASWMRGERYVHGETEGDLGGELPDVVPFGDEAVDQPRSAHAASARADGRRTRWRGRHERAAVVPARRFGVVRSLPRIAGR